MLLELKKSIKSANNIYDIMVCFYNVVVVVSDKENKVIESFCKSIEGAENLEIQKKVGGLLKGYLDSSVFDDYFTYFKDELIELIDEINMSFVLIFLLYRFDKELLAKDDFSILGLKKRLSIAKMYKVGPLNTEHMEAYGFYLNPIQSIIKNSKVYEERKFRLPDLSSGRLDSLLENFQIIDKSPVNPIVEINLFSGIKLFSEVERRC